MTKPELEKKHLSELHALAKEAGVERYRMLPRAELIAKLADGEGGGGARAAAASGSSSSERPPRRRRRRAGGGEGGGEQRSPAKARKPERKQEPEPDDGPEETSTPSAPAAPASAASSGSSKPRRRRRRRFGRRGKQGVTLQGLLLPPAGRQALLAAESREACTSLLRGIAAELSDANGPDPIALLVDPSPEELAEWRRDAPRAEIVAAGQPRHADDALAQAKSRAADGEDVILLIDSLTRLGEAHSDADAAKEFFDAAGGNLTVVAALERS